jgi:hypothetical protein
VQAEPHFSWLREFVVPVFFTLFGAALGYIATVVSDERKARRDKQAFLRAVGMELDALSDQLDGSFHEVKGSIERIQGGIGGPQFAWALRTSVFTSQIGNLRDVDDPLMVKVIHFYSDLGTLHRIFESVNGLSSEYVRANIPSGEKDSARSRLRSALLVLQEQIGGFAKRLRELRAKLPPAEPPK